MAAQSMRRVDDWQTWRVMSSSCDVRPSGPPVGDRGTSKEIDDRASYYYHNLFNFITSTQAPPELKDFFLSLIFLFADTGPKAGQRGGGGLTAISGAPGKNLFGSQSLP
jgi:hypothetical protein